MALVNFMVTPAGRVARIVVGVVLVIVGFVVQGAGGVVISVVGLLPIVTGAMNVCLLGALLGADLWGNPRTPGSGAR
jgi:hypothetical protein